MERLKNKKVFVGKYSREIQEKAFELGFSWFGYSNGDLRKIQNIMYIEKPFLLFEEDGSICYGSDVEHFNNHDNEEVTPEYILNLKVEKRPQWEDFGEVTGFFVSGYSKVEYYINNSSFEDNANTFPTKQEALARLALSQLCQWRDKYNDGWKPDWTDDTNKFIIEYYKDEIYPDYYTDIQRVLAFKAKEIRDKFLEDFRDLIEQAKPLL